MRHHFCALASLAVLIMTAPGALAATTLIHAGRLLAIPGEPPKSEQTIVIEGQRIVGIQSGYADPSNFDGDVTVIDLRAQFVLPGLMDMHVHLQFELGPTNDSENLRMSNQQAQMRSVMFGMRTLRAGFTTVRDVGSSSQEMYAPA